MPWFSAVVWLSQGAAHPCKQAQPVPSPALLSILAEPPKTATSKCAHHQISASSLFLPGKCHGLRGHSSG